MSIEIISLKIMELLQSKTTMSLLELRLATGLNNRQLLKEITEINYFFKINGYDNFININEESHVALHEQNIDIKDIRTKMRLILKPEERINFIYCYVFGNPNKEIGIENLAELLSVSRNTIINDLNNLRLRLENNKIRIKFNENKGYIIEGSDIERRMYFLKSYTYIFGNSHVLLDHLLKNLDIKNTIQYRLKNSFRNLEHDYFKDQNHFSNGEASGLLLLLNIIFTSNPEVNYSPGTIKNGNKLFDLVNSKFSYLPSGERSFLLLMLSSMQTQMVDNEANTTGISFIFANIILTEFTSLTNISFKDINLVLNAIAKQITNTIDKSRHLMGFEDLLVKTVNKEINNLTFILKNVIYDNLPGWFLEHTNKLVKQLAIIIYSNISPKELIKKTIVALYFPHSYIISSLIKQEINNTNFNIHTKIISKRQLVSGQFDILITHINSTRIIKNLNERTLILKLPITTRDVKEINDFLAVYHDDKISFREKQSLNFITKKTNFSNIHDIIASFCSLNEKIKVTIEKETNFKILTKYNLLIIFFNTGFGRNSYVPNNTLYRNKREIKDYENILQGNINVLQVAFINNNDIATLFEGLKELYSKVNDF